MSREERDALADKLKRMEVSVEERDAAIRPEPPYVGGLHPETPDVESHWEPAPPMVRLVKLAMLLMGSLLFFGLPYGIGWVFGIGWLMTTGYVLGGFGVAVSILQVATAKVAECPFCGEYMGTTVDSDISALDDNQRVACEHCFEYVISHKGTLRPMNAQDAQRFKTFEAPVFVRATWPDECIVCGAGVTHKGSASRHQLELSQLLLGTISISRAALNGVPYCDEHDDEVSLAIHDEKLYLVFRTLAQQRRYLDVNDVGDIVRVKES